MSSCSLKKHISVSPARPNRRGAETGSDMTVLADIHEIFMRRKSKSQIQEAYERVHSEGDRVPRDARTPGLPRTLTARLIVATGGSRPRGRHGVARSSASHDGGGVSEDRRGRQEDLHSGLRAVTRSGAAPGRAAHGTRHRDCGGRPRAFREGSPPFRARYGLARLERQRKEIRDPAEDVPRSGSSSFTVADARTLRGLSCWIPDLLALRCSRAGPCRARKEVGRR